MDSTEDQRATRVIVRALALRAIESVGGVLSPGQLRWALEPVLADHVVPGQPEPVVAPPRTARAWRNITRVMPPVGTRPAAAEERSAILSAVDCKGSRKW
jgi:hypothetical protein